MWLHFRFNLSLRDAEGLLAEREIIISLETIRFRVGKFCRQYAKAIRRNRPPVGDKLHLDDVVISNCGEKHWLWRAAGQNGNALKILVQSRRNPQAAKRFMRKLIKQYGTPRVLTRTSYAPTALQNAIW